MKSGYVLMAEMFKALGDENRLRLLEELKGGEKNAGELLESLSVSQPTLSHHMKILCDSGIVDARREGKWTYYKISREGKKELLDIINSLTDEKNVSSFALDEILVSDAAGEETVKAPKTKKTAKKKSVVKKEDVIKEILTPPETEEKLPEVAFEEPKEQLKEEEKEERRERNMPSWLF